MCYPLSPGFVPFDGAKLRRNSEPTMDFWVLCAKTAPFVDLYQNIVANKKKGISSKKKSVFTAYMSSGRPRLIGDFHYQQRAMNVSCIFAEYAEYRQFSYQALRSLAVVS